MKKKNIPIVSIITLNLLIIGVLFTSRFEMAFIWLTWAICAADVCRVMRECRKYNLQSG